MEITKKNEALGFNGLGIAPKLLNIITETGYSIPTPIQTQAIPVSLKQKDMVGIAQTGTGKTLAFGIPMIQLLATHKGVGLVILPTRELAIQVDEHIKQVGRKIGLRTAVLIGGEPINKQLKAIRRKPHILIATPGRLFDFTKRKLLSLKNVKVLVLDEADRMLDMGFLPQIKAILKLIPKQRQTMLFSATMPAQVLGIASEYMSLPVTVEVAPSGTAAENVEQEIFVIEREKKFDLLAKTLKEVKGSVLIFTRTKHGAKNLTRKISAIGMKAAEIHSNRSLIQRQKALAGFKTGLYRVLVATDIAARGIDVKDIALVVNYDIPDDSEDYVHRIGRTGRAGKSGKAVTLVAPNQLRNVRDIEKLINKSLKLSITDANFNVIKKIPINKPERGTRARKGMIGGAKKRSRKPFQSSHRSVISVKARSATLNYNRFSSESTGDARKYKSPSHIKNRSVAPGKSKTIASKRRIKKFTPANLPLTGRQKFRKSIATKGRR